MASLGCFPKAIRVIMGMPYISQAPRGKSCSKPSPTVPGRKAGFSITWPHLVLKLKGPDVTGEAAFTPIPFSQLIPSWLGEWGTLPCFLCKVPGRRPLTGRSLPVLDQRLSGAGTKGDVEHTELCAPVANPEAFITWDICLNN